MTHEERTALEAAYTRITGERSWLAYEVDNITVEEFLDKLHERGYGIKLVALVESRVF